MKTSNIILISFFTIVFLSPLLIVLALKSKISKGKYASISNSRREHERILKTGDYSVLVIKGASMPLACTVMTSDFSEISYQSFRNDSVHFTNVNDTLTVFYVGGNNNYNDGDQFGMLIHARHPSLIQVERASVTVVPGEYFRKNKLNVELYDSAVLKLNSYSVNRGTDPKASVDSGSLIQFEHLAVKSRASAIHLSPYYQINQLSLDVSDHSKIYVSRDFNFRTLSGAISDDTEIQGPWLKVKGFKGIEEREVK